MKDTSPRMERKFRKMLLDRSGEERLKMGCSMHAAGQALVRASPVMLRQALFLRFYGHEFDLETREKILIALEKSDGREGANGM